MTTPVHETTDLEAIAHLDQPTPPCDRDECRSGHPPATHVWRSRFCPCAGPRLLCDPCAESWHGFLRVNGGRVRCWGHRPCGAHIHADIALLITVHPL